MLPNDFASMSKPWLEALRAVPMANGDAGADPLALLKLAFGLSGAAPAQPFETVLSLLQRGGLAPLTDGFRVLAELGQENLRHISEAWSGADRAAWQALLGAPTALAANPIAVGAERTFGAFADAFGMRPMRELQDALQRLAGTEVQRRAALSAYLGVVAEAFGEGSRQLLARLAEMGARGEQVTSLVAFARLWAQQVDGAMQKALQSEAGLAASMQAMRAASQRRGELQRLVALASTTLNIPTRAEVDDAFREIQQLKRELRRLKKGPTAEADEAAPPPARKAARSRSAAKAPKTRKTPKTRQTGARA